MEKQHYKVEPERDEKSPVVDAQAIARNLMSKVKGEVRFDDGTRAMYSTDSSNYRQYPIGVVIPKNEEDIINTIEICKYYGAPVLTRGGGTSLNGQCCNVAVVMDFSKYYNNVLNIDAYKKLITVQPGIVLDEMKKVAEEQGLTFGPDPSTHNHCTIGGMLGNNSCGIHSVLSVRNGLGARAGDNMYEMEIITHDGVRMRVGPTSDEELEKIIKEGGRKGEIYKKLRDFRDKYADEIRKKFPQIPRRVSGYNLDELLPEKGFNVARALCGSEGTLVTILNSTMMLVPKPKATALLVLGYPNVADAGRHACDIMKYGCIGLEGVDHKLYEFLVFRNLHVEDLKLLPKGKAWLLAEFAGETQKDADDRVRSVMDELKKKGNAPDMVFYDEKSEEHKIWKIRESGLGATAFVRDRPDAWEGWEDSSVPPEHLGDYLEDLQNLFHKYGYDSALYGHFGQGCVHCRINFDLVSDPGLKKYRRFVNEAAELVVKYGGSLSGEHGDGQSKAELLPIMYGEKIIEAFREFKRIWDPKNLMNPGKVVEPYPILSNLRLGINYNPPQLKTHFRYPEDRFSFSRAVLRCVGVGECRKHDTGTMCPSYMVTREEKDTTRGRAHSLFEMINGDVISEGFKSEYIKESLDLCLACKGCKGECPVKVDMATYKAEFLAHYYKGKIRPLHAYAFGLIAKFSRIATKMPRLSNMMLNSAFPGKLIKKVMGIAEQRKMPAYADENFKDWYFKRKPVNQEGPEVIVWPDTFNNYFHPDVAKATVEVLEYFGYKVKVPMDNFCCGRPLYDFGMLDTAKKWLYQIMNGLKDELRRGIPIILLEPSCYSVFKDELINFFPDYQDADRLVENSYLLSEFLLKNIKDEEFPQLKRKAIVHGHCHHKALTKMKEEDAVLKKIGLDFQILDDGCCGLAGAFGYVDTHYDISVACGERVLLPAVRKADKDTLLITNGFSCHSQVNQQTGIKMLHLSEVLKMAIENEKEQGERIEVTNREAVKRRGEQERREEKRKGQENK